MFIEGVDDILVINFVVEDMEEEQLKEYYFKVIFKMVEERVKVMKDYFFEIVSVLLFEDIFFFYLECY